jgi:hypothetical protein
VDKGVARKSTTRVVATEQLVQLGGTLSVLKLVSHVAKDTTANQQQQSAPPWPHQFTHDLLWLLAHLAQRGAFPFIHYMPCQSMFDFFCF